MSGRSSYPALRPSPENDSDPESGPSQLLAATYRNSDTRSAMLAAGVNCTFVADENCTLFPSSKGGLSRSSRADSRFLFTLVAFEAESTM
jgi:hypothetical protein